MLPVPVQLLAQPPAPRQAEVAAARADFDRHRGAAQLPGAARVADMFAGHGPVSGLAQRRRHVEEHGRAGGRWEGLGGRWSRRRHVEEHGALPAEGGKVWGVGGHGVAMLKSMVLCRRKVGGTLQSC